MGRTRDQKARKVEVSPLTVHQDGPHVTCPFVPELTHLSPMSSTPSLLQCFTSEPLSSSPWLLGTKSVAPLQKLDGVPGSHRHPCTSSGTPRGVKNHRSWRVSFQSAELFDFLSQQCSFAWLQFFPQPKTAVRHAPCVCGGMTSHPAYKQTNPLFCRMRMLKSIATSCNSCLCSAATEVSFVLTNKDFYQILC